MKFGKISKLLVSIIICEFAGVVGGVFTARSVRVWYPALNKPFFNPPNWIFGPVWTILFVLMGISLFIVWEKNFAVKNNLTALDNKIKRSPSQWSKELWSGKWQKLNIILVFGAQLVLNILWSAIFFGARNPALAFFELIMLWAAIIYTIINFYRVSKASAYLLVPYILWVTFAGVLNFVIWIIN